MNLFYQPLLPDQLYLDEEESRHCVKVLRIRNGEAIRITDGRGSFYDAVITDASQKRCVFAIREQIPEQPRDYHIHIAIAPTKNPDRLEWFVEKATELGVDRITFIRTEHSERVYLKKERLLRMAVSAMKQSLKPTLPDLSDLTDLPTLLEKCDEQERFIAFVDESNPLHLKDCAVKGKSYLILIGPEGDFSKGELEMATGKGFVKVSLGGSRLRTETAGMAACHILNLINS